MNQNSKAYYNFFALSETFSSLQQEQNYLSRFSQVNQLLNMNVQAQYRDLLKSVNAIQQLNFSNAFAQFSSPELTKAIEAISSAASVNLRQALNIQYSFLNLLSQETELYAKLKFSVDSLTQSYIQSFTKIALKNDVLPQLYNLTHSVSLNLDKTSDSPSNLETLSPECTSAVSEEIKEIFSEEKNWEQRCMDSIQKFKTVHPVWSNVLNYLIFQIVLALIINISSSIIAETITNTKLRKEPNTSSQVILTIEPQQTLVIIGDEPYYYQVEVQADDYAETITGYVSKRSTKILQQIEHQCKDSD